MSEKNISGLKNICRGFEGAALDLPTELLGIYGPIDSVYERVKLLLAPYENEKIYVELFDLLDSLRYSDNSGCINIDFSVIDDINYYSGIVFKGFIEGIPDAVLSGGRYDRLMKKMGQTSSAIGFAFYVDLLEQEDMFKEKPKDDEWLNIALPKGRLGDNVYDLFAKAGYECPSILDPGRKLIFENKEKKIRYFWVKPSDVAVYVERGTADAGVAGKDILLETGADIYELLDMKVGKCRMCVAAPKGYTEDNKRTLRVATKFSNITKEYYRSKGRDIDIVHLNGSVEIAPILGLTDVIMDIVETGNTLKENDLEIVETAVADISARFISNKTSLKFKSGRIEDLVKSLASVMEDEQ